MSEVILARISDIPDTTTKEDLRHYISTHISLSDPEISSLFTDPGTGNQFATFVFKSRSRAGAEEDIESLLRDGVELQDSGGTRYIPAISSSCLGITTLANKRQDPSFDVCFVHGLGGHPLRTFYWEGKDHQNGTLWPRDLLPKYLENAEYHGRYMTFGYDAPWTTSDLIRQSLQDKAEELLRALIRVRGKHCNRPLFFICHSLGGLVVCQAALLAFKNSRIQSSELYRNAFNGSQSCTIRGIIFFGTPFEGSRFGNLMAFSARIALNGAYLDPSIFSYLAVNNKDVKKIMDEFKRCYKQDRVELLTYFEQRKSGWGPLKDVVVSRASAQGKFDKDVHHKPLRATHREMVKFHNDTDPLFTEDVGPDIKNLIFDALGDLKQLRNLQDAFDKKAVPITTKNNPVSFAPMRAGNFEGGSMKEVFGEPNATSRFGAHFNPRGSNLEESAMRFFDEMIRRHATLEMVTERVFDDTCDWLMRHDQYQKWLTASGNAVLFIEGGPGYGKSVLARHVIHKLRENPRNHPIQTASESEDLWQQPHDDTSPAKPPLVTYFLSNKQRNRDPETILKDIACQLMEQDRPAMFEFAMDLLDRYGEAVDTRFLWFLISRCPEKLSRDVYCVVDGLDECIDAFKPEGRTTVDDKMHGFLESVCDLSRTDFRQGKGRIRVLLTTRFREEVSNAVQGRDMVLKMNKLVIGDSFEKMVKTQIDVLAANQLFPQELQDFAIQEITHKCSPIFQMAHQLLEQLKRRKLNNRAILGECIANFRSETLDDSYLGILEKIPVQYRSNMGKILRLLFFSAEPLLPEELGHALAIASGSEQSPPQKDSHIASVDFLRRLECGSLIKVLEDSAMVLDHQSIYDFLESLDATKWKTYTCHNTKEGHLNLALICIKILRRWRSEVPQPYGTAVKDQEHSVEHQSFLAYAVRYWDYHVYHCAELIIPHRVLFEQFFTADMYHDFFAMQHLRYHSSQVEDEDSDFKYLPPDSFVADRSLLHLMAIFHSPIIMKPTQKRRRHFRLFRKPKPLTSQAPDGVDSVNSIDSANKRSCLHYACANGDLEMVEYLLSCGAIGIGRDAEGHTPFWIAVAADSEDIALLLINSGQAYDYDGNSTEIRAIHMACYKKMEAVVAVMVGIKDLAKQRTFDNWTPAHLAALTGSAKIMRIILEAGGDGAAAMSNGDTPLHLAAGAGNLEVIEFLFEKVAALDPAPVNTKGQTPLYRAIRSGNILVSRLLLSKNPDVPPDKDGWYPAHVAACNGHLEMLKWFQQSPTIHAKTKAGSQTIHLAAQFGHLNTVQYLIEDCSVDVDTVFENYDDSTEPPTPRPVTPLWLAAVSGQTEVARYLISRKAYLDVHSEGYTLMHAMARNGDHEMMRILQGKGLDPFAEDRFRSTPLHEAARSGKLKSVEVYLDGVFGQDYDIAALVNRQGDGQCTVLHIASDGHNVDIIQKLLICGANPSIDDENGCRALSYAARKHDPAMLKLVLAKDNNVNHPNLFGNTALHEAAHLGCSESVGLLREHGADVNIVNGRGATPLLIAALRSNMDVFTRLLQDPKIIVSQRDIFSNTVFDYVRHKPLFLDFLKPWASEDTELTQEEHDEYIRRTIGTRLRSFPLQQGLGYATQWGLIWDLGRSYLHLRKENEARVVFEQRVKRLSEGNWTYQAAFCDCCEGGKRGTYWICKICPDSGICDECYQEKKRPIGCSRKHERLDVGGESWKKLKSNEVEPGITFEQWLETQNAEYPLPASSHNDTGATGPDNQKQSLEDAVPKSARRGQTTPMEANRVGHQPRSSPEDLYTPPPTHPKVTKFAQKIAPPLVRSSSRPLPPLTKRRTWPG